jgi:hypothetical protein
VLVGGKCVTPVTPVTCTAPQVLVNGKCVTPAPTCPTGYTFENGICVSTTGPATCPAGEYPVNGVCEATPVPCPGGYVDASGNCVPVNAPVPSNGVCPNGWQIDSAGNCTPAGSESNPYSLYLPSNDVPSPDTNPAVPAGCATGDFQDLAGNCFPNTLVGWMEASTLVAGVPNYEIVGGAAAGALILFLMMSGNKTKPTRARR